MSLLKNGAVRCDRCGKLSRHPLGEYTRPDGSAGYISSHGRDDAEDYCEECEAGRCPQCGSAELVQITPATPGPDGWGWRCKQCGNCWSLRGVEAPPA